MFYITQNWHASHIFQPTYITVIIITTAKVVMVASTLKGTTFNADPNKKSIPAGSKHV